MGHNAEQRVPVPHDSPILKPPQLVRLAVIMTIADLRPQLDREEVRQLSRQAGFAPQQHVMGEEEVGGSA